MHVDPFPPPMSLKEGEVPPGGLAWSAKEHP
jgi:hypothetical protein